MSGQSLHWEKLTSDVSCPYDDVSIVLNQKMTHGMYSQRMMWRTWQVPSTRSNHLMTRVMVGRANGFVPRGTYVADETIDFTKIFGRI